MNARVQHEALDSVMAMWATSTRSLFSRHTVKTLVEFCAKRAEFVDREQVFAVVAMRVFHQFGELVKAYQQAGFDITSRRITDLMAWSWERVQKEEHAS
jgi:hypothetical protein